MSGNELAIRAVGLTKRFRSGGGYLTVFENLSLEVYRGERLAVVGPSGAGKSTLLHLLGGLDSPDSGQIYYGNKDITQLDEDGRAWFRNREIGFVWQMPTLLPEFSLLENVMMPLLIAGVPAEEAKQRAMHLLEEVGLQQRWHHRGGELSGGEQQRAVLARALIHEPSCLLADEPTGNLDRKSALAVMDLIERLHRSRTLTTVVATHNWELAERCDRILELRAGVLAPLSSGTSQREVQLSPPPVSHRHES